MRQIREGTDSTVPDRAGSRKQRGNSGRKYREGSRSVRGGDQSGTWGECGANL